MRREVEYLLILLIFVAVMCFVLTYLLFIDVLAFCVVFFWTVAMSLKILCYALDGKNMELRFK